ncbi:hypothetical protein [Leptospira sp. GIMC2001]|uniref:hypothetical protein n=1 Tax=Leptospira sp. GIMC2001 TaxID=1513297 RepID=UPI00234A464E|nr:hypothetical protein [Leptospira sp. GIMC2001]WCL50017.1 hypothetical protein O4O04_04140 [Leptospira sp. GIMC2001]
MKKLSFLLLVFVLLVGCSTASKNVDQSKSDLDLYPKRFEAILTQLVILVNGRKNSDDNLHVVLLNNMNRINAGFLKLSIDPTLPSSIEGGAIFAFDSAGSHPGIYISPYLVDLYEKRPSLVYSILIHEFQHADSYFTNKDLFILTRDNPVEKYLYEMDAYHLEALFIKNYLAHDKRFILSEFEKFLSSSHSKDNLASFSQAAYKFDMRLVYYLHGLVRSPKNKLLKYKELNETTDSILTQDFEKYEEDWVQYNQVVPLFTIGMLYAQFVRDIETYPATDEDISRMANFDLKKDNPQSYAKLEIIEKKLIKYQDRLNYANIIKKKYLNAE